MLSFFVEVEAFLDVFWVCPLYTAEKELLCLTVGRAGRPATSLKHLIFKPGSAIMVRCLYGALTYFLFPAGLAVRLLRPVVFFIILS